MQLSPTSHVGNIALNYTANVHILMKNFCQKLKMQFNNPMVSSAYRAT